MYGLAISRSGAPTVRLTGPRSLALLIGFSKNDLALWVSQANERCSCLPLIEPNCRMPLNFIELRRRQLFICNSYS